jgi:hypothetical protein
MFFDTSLNSRSTVILNIYTAFVETATKMWSYSRCLPVKKQPTTMLVISEYSHSGIPYTIVIRRSIDAIQDVIGLAYMLLRSKSRKKNNHGFKCTVSKVQLEWYGISNTGFWIDI